MYECWMCEKWAYNFFLSFSSSFSLTNVCKRTPPTYCCRIFKPKWRCYISSIWMDHIWFHIYSQHILGFLHFILRVQQHKRFQRQNFVWKVCFVVMRIKNIHTHGNYKNSLEMIFSSKKKNHHFIKWSPFIEKNWKKKTFLRQQVRQLHN